MKTTTRLLSGESRNLAPDTLSYPANIKGGWGALLHFASWRKRPQSPLRRRAAIDQMKDIGIGEDYCHRVASFWTWNILVEDWNVVLHRTPCSPTCRGWEMPIATRADKGGSKLVTTQNCENAVSNRMWILKGIVEWFRFLVMERTLWASIHCSTAAAVWGIKGDLTYGPR